MGRYRIEKIGDFLVVLCLFFAAMNFDAKFFYFALGAAIVMLLTTKEPKFDRALLLYVLLSGCIGVYSFYYQGFAALVRCFSYFALYWVGYNAVRTRKGKLQSEKRVYFLLLVIALGSFCHYILNFLFNLGKGAERNTNDIWTGEILSATGQAALATLMIGLTLACILAAPKFFQRVLGTLALIAIGAYSLVLAGRTIFAVSVIVFIVGFIFLLINQESSDARLKSIGIIFAFAAVGSLLLVLNIGGIWNVIKESNLFSRFEGSSFSELLETGRTDRKLYFLKNMIHHIWGGGYMRAHVGFAHDLLLDAYDEYGIFALILLICVLVHGIKNLIIFCKNKEIELLYRVVVLCVYTAILLEFCIEPILAGMPWLFVCYCLINGGLAGANKSFHFKADLEFNPRKNRIYVAQGEKNDFI